MTFDAADPLTLLLPRLQTRLGVSSAAIVAFCQRHPIRRLALFGSILHDDFDADSDTDVLVEFEKTAVIGWHIVTIADDLSAAFGRPVDLRPPELSRHFRLQVLREAQVIYERS